MIVLSVGLGMVEEADSSVQVVGPPVDACAQQLFNRESGARPATTWFWQWPTHLNGMDTTTVGSLSLRQPSSAFSAVVMLHPLASHHLCLFHHWDLLLRHEPPSQPASRGWPCQEHSSRRFSSLDLRHRQASPPRQGGNHSIYHSGKPTSTQLTWSHTWCVATSKILEHFCALTVQVVIVFRLGKGEKQEGVCNFFKPTYSKI